MKKRFFIGLMIVIFICLAQYAQTEEKLYKYTFKKGVGTCNFTGSTFDDVWAAAVKALMESKFTITTTDKQSGNLIAEHKEWPYIDYAINLFFEKVDSNIRVTSSIRLLKYDQGVRGLLQEVALNKEHEEVEKKIYDKMAKFLYKNEK